MDMLNGSEVDARTVLSRRELASHACHGASTMRNNHHEGRGKEETTNSKFRPRWKYISNR